MFASIGGSFYSMDLLAVAAINRSMATLSGFRQMIENRNFVCAGSLLRVQLDTALRIAAAHLAPDLNQFVHEVMEGTQIRKLRARDGQQMKDAYLVRMVAKDYPWIENVYRQTSGYIHLSEKHFLNAITAVGDGGEISMKMSPLDKTVPDESYVEAIEAFLAATGIFFRYLEGWVATKVARSARKPAAF